MYKMETVQTSPMPNSPVVDNLRINDIILTPDEESVKSRNRCGRSDKYIIIP